MIKHKHIGTIAVLLMAAAVLITGYACLVPSAFASSANGASTPAYAAAMDKEQVMDIQIIADEGQWAAMLESATAEEYIPATIIINDEKIENVGIRPKGNSSLSMVAQSSTSDRFSFKIEFDHYITGQTWRGLDKLAVNNMQGDASYMKEYFSYELMSYAGVAAPLYAYADISVNGKTWGFYLAVECLEESYAQRVYGRDHGKLYKPESMGMRGGGRMNEFIEGMQEGGSDIEGLAEEWQAQRGMRAPDMEQGEAPQNQEPEGMFPEMGEGGAPPDRMQMEMSGGFPGMPGGESAGGGFGGGMGGMAGNGVSLQYTGDEVSNYSAIFDNAVFKATNADYTRVIQALEKLSNGEDLEQVVDVEAVLKYFAAHTFVVNLDSYISNMGHNYYLYEDDGQLTILPWDYNLAFGGFQSGGASSVVNFPIDTPVSGVSAESRPLIGKLLEVPKYVGMYHEYLRQIVDGYFNSGLFEQKVDALNERIAPHVANDPTAFYDYEAYGNAVAEFKKLGLLRADSVEGQLDGTIPSTTEGQQASASALVDASNINLSTLGSQGGFGGGGGMERPGGNRDAVDGARQPGGGRVRPEGRMAQPGGQMENPVGGGADSAGRQPGAATAIDANTWLLLGGCAVLLAAGLLLVMRFKRRRN